MNGTIALLFLGFVVLLTLAIKAFAAVLGRLAGAEVRRSHETAEYIIATGKIPQQWLAAAKSASRRRPWRQQVALRQQIEQDMEQLIRHFEKSPLVADEPTRQLLLSQLQTAQRQWLEAELNE